MVSSKKRGGRADGREGPDRRSLTARREHPPVGEEAQVDFCKGPTIVDAKTGEVHIA